MRLHICLCKVQEKLPAEVTLFVQQRTRNMLYVRHEYLLKLPFSKPAYTGFNRIK